MYKLLEWNMNLRDCSTKELITKIDFNEDISDQFISELIDFGNDILSDIGYYKNKDIYDLVESCPKSFGCPCVGPKENSLCYCDMRYALYTNRYRIALYLKRCDELVESVNEKLLNLKIVE